MKIAAFFDMDGTLLRGESQFSFLIWLFKRGLVHPVGAVRVLGMYSSYLLGFSSDAHRLRKAGFSLVGGMAELELKKCGEMFCGSHLSNRIRRFAETLIKAHQKAGHQIVLVTSAAEVVALPLAEKFQFGEVIATRLSVKNGALTGQIEQPEPYANGKQQLVKEFCDRNQISLSDCFAYSDHHSDLPLLELVGKPVVVNPTKKMRHFSIQRGWKILDLETESNLIGQ